METAEGYRPIYFTAEPLSHSHTHIYRSNSTDFPENYNSPTHSSDSSPTPQLDIAPCPSSPPAQHLYHVVVNSKQKPNSSPNSDRISQIRPELKIFTPPPPPPPRPVMPLALLAESRHTASLGVTSAGIPPLQKTRTRRTLRRDWQSDQMRKHSNKPDDHKPP